jgi:hypothetical protein
MTNFRKSNSAQAWFTDFAIGMLIFMFMLIAYYSYVSNISQHDGLVMKDLISDAESLSSSLLLPGFPEDWDDTYVESIGITNDNQNINKTKIIDFKDMEYQKTKTLFGITSDYFIYFLDENGNIANVEGICGIGAPEINVTYKVKSAYYYDNAADSFLKEFMEDSLNADIYSAEPGYDDFETLISNINEYGFVVIEHSMLTTSTFTNNKDKLENFTANRGLLMLSGYIVNAQGREMAGVKYYKKAVQSISDRNSTVTSEDEFLAFTEGEHIVFRQAYYVENQSGAKNFTEIVRFNADNRIAVARWDYGNGSVFYFSDFDVSYFEGEFVDEVTDAVKRWGKFECNPINLSGIPYENLVKIERLLIYDSKPIRMVSYVWQ